MSNTNPTSDATKPSTSSSCTSFSAFKSLGRIAKQNQPQRPVEITPKSIVEDMSKKANEQEEWDKK